MLLLAAVIFSGAIITKQYVYSHVQQSGYEVVLNHLALLKENDIDKAYQLSSSEFQGMTSLREFSRFIERHDIFQKRSNTKFTSQLVEDDYGSFKIEVTDADQNITKLDYDVIKEDGAWKILHIMITPPPSMQVDFGETLVDRFDQKPQELTKVFDNKENHFIVKYPDRWEQTTLDNGTTILSGKSGTRAYYSTINIQTVLTKKSGGRFKTVKQLVDDIKRQVETMSKDSIFLESGPIELTEKNGSKATGEYLIFTYRYNGNSYQQWSVIVSRNDGQVFYVWAYTSPSKQYTTDLPLAQAILKAWQIY